MDIEGIQHVLQEQPDRQAIGTVSLDVLTVGALMRGSFKRSLAELSSSGVQVHIQSIDKGWIETTYYGIKLTGTAETLLQWVNWLAAL